MAKQRESKLSLKIQHVLRDAGHFVFKVHGSEFMLAGLPDLIVCAEGYFIGLEVKLPEDRHKVSQRQVYVHRLIVQSGGNVGVVCSVGEALMYVERTVNALRDS